jgi:hypothetical protein
MRWKFTRVARRHPDFRQHKAEFLRRIFCPFFCVLEFFQVKDSNVPVGIEFKTDVPVFFD